MLKTDYHINAYSTKDFFKNWNMYIQKCEMNEICATVYSKAIYLVT